MKLTFYIILALALLWLSSNALWTWLTGGRF